MAKRLTQLMQTQNRKMPRADKIAREQQETAPRASPEAGVK